MDDPVVLDHLGDIYFKLGDLAKARDAWEKSYKLDPENLKVKEKLNLRGLRK